MCRIQYFVYAMLLVSFVSCKEAYRPDIISTEKSYLVVEGLLNVNGPTSITLTRSAQLYATNGFTPVTGAQLTVEGRDNSTRTLTAAGVGIYGSANLNLAIGQEYRLRIRTNDGKVYVSEFVTARQTPAIDSIGWKREQEGLRIYANSHDASGNTRYYRYEYDETWEIRTYYYSRYKYTGTGVRERIMPAEDVSTCWKYDYSKNIVLASSARLGSDVIYQAPINFIPNFDEKLAVRYSILLRQYAMDKAGYDFYDLMKKNTESLGTIFDAQPSEQRGNIICETDPTELVIGYVSASTISQKRIFINNLDIPDWRTYQDCQTMDVANNPDSIRIFFGVGGYSPIDANYSMALPGVIVSYWSSYPRCVDCTERGGSLGRPSYW